MKKQISIIMILIISLLAFGCQSKPTGVNSVNVIRISYVKLPLNIPSIIEKELKMFEQEFTTDKIRIEFPEITAGPKMTEAMAAGSLDFCNALGGTSAILAAANGVDLKIIGVYSRAPRAFVIMTNNPAVKSVKDLKGKNIAGPKGTILHQLLLAAQQKNGLNAGEIRFVNMGIPAAVSAMLSGNVEAALVAGPAVVKAAQAGARIIEDGDGLLDATIVIAVRGEFLKQHPDLVKRYMKVHNRSLQYMKNNMDKTLQLAADETQIPLEDVKSMIEWYDFNPKITERDINELKKTQEFLVQNGLLTKKIDIKTILSD